jgi:hypothetical protein
MGDISKGVTNTHLTVKKYTENKKNKNSIRSMRAVMLQEKNIKELFYYTVSTGKHQKTGRVKQKIKHKMVACFNESLTTVIP